jgi:transposase InsO family protein
MDYQWGADTAVMRSYMDNNSGYGFILLVIDFFSRYVWTKPLQSAKGSEMVDALRSILAMGRNPMTLFTDKGKEYCNSNVRNVLKQRGIDNFASQNEQTSVQPERTIKTMKLKLSRYMTHHQTHRWIDVLD